MKTLTMKTTHCWISILAFATLSASTTPDGYALAPEVQTPGKNSLDGAKAPAEQARAAAPAAPSKETGPGDGKGLNRDNIEAEREQIWNSPEMLSARVWLETYFERSAKISDKQAKKYMDGLKTMYPDQMRLWLVKFQTDRDSRKQQYASERMARQNSISMRQASPQVGGFRNPYAGRRAISSGQPIGNVRQTYGGAHPIARQQPIQKPFAGQSVQRPLVTSEEVARWEILRGLGWAPY